MQRSPKRACASSALSRNDSHLRLLTFDGGEARVAVAGSSDIVAARKMGTQYALRLGFSATETALIIAIVSEVARIIMQCAARASLTFSVVQNGPHQGLEVVARGEPAAAAGDLSSVGKLMDECTIVCAGDSGTTVRLTKWRR